MTALFEFRFFWHFVTLVFSLISVYVGQSVPLQIFLWSVFAVFVIYSWFVEKKKFPFPFLFFPAFVLTGGVGGPVTPVLFLLLPYFLKKYGLFSYVIFAVSVFVLMICSGNISDEAAFASYVLFVFSAVAVWFFIEKKNFSFFMEPVPATPLKITPKVSSSLVEDPFRPLKKYLSRTKNFNGKPVSLRLVELLPGGMAKIYETESEFRQEGLLYRVVHDKTPVAAKTLLAEIENIPMMPEYNFRIYYPLSLLENGDSSFFEPEYVLVVDIAMKEKSVDKDELIAEFAEIRTDVAEQLKQSETFSHISVEKQRNAALYRETSNIVDSFEHDELLKAAALAIFNLAPESSGVFVAEKSGGEAFNGYAFGIAEASKGKWPLEMTDIKEIAKAEIKDQQSVHAMMVCGKMDDYFEATDVNKRKNEPLFQSEFDDFNRKSCISIRLLTFKNDVKGTISVLTDTQKDFELLKDHSDSIRMISKVVTSALNNIELFKKMEELSNVDGLTGLYNRRCFNNMIERKTSEAGRMKVPLSMIMLDIDHFKKVNDVYGHKAGDDVIRFISKTIRNSIRKVDFAARYGGEEFVILLNNTTVESAAKIAEKIRNLVRDASVNADGIILSVTASFGVSSFPEPSMSAGELVKDADTALYYSKEHGRDQVNIFNREM
ncbi:diguanylate cyclase [bacterium]|nr:diguanylate cyclase [bacterium]